MRQWHKTRKKEFFYKKAKEEKYRARSAYKLLELQKKFRLIESGDIVVDCGAAPGSWSQVALQFVGANGRVLAIDILPMAELSGNFTFLRADLTKESTLDKIRTILQRPADLVMSDAAPEFSGIRAMDIGRAMDLNKIILELARKILKKGGSFVCKAFQGKDFQDFVKEVKKYFSNVHLEKPKASLKESAEIYIVALKLK
ncbi:MAG: RlmE family RNA methyltransferase [Candidatus Nanoarchaeia archaeon]